MAYPIQKILVGDLWKWTKHFMLVVEVRQVVIDINGKKGWFIRWLNINDHVTIERVYSSSNVVINYDTIGIRDGLILDLSSFQDKL